MQFPGQEQSNEICPICHKRTARGTLTAWIFRRDSGESICSGCLPGTAEPEQEAPAADSAPVDGAEQPPAAQVSEFDSIVGTTLGGRYEIQSLIGVGGMSYVYKAQHLLLDKPVALKLLLPGQTLDPKAVRRLQQEAKTAASLDHRNIVKVHEFELIEPGKPLLVMDFVDGVPLGDLIADGAALPLNRSMSILFQVCDALKHAHSRGVIHRDLKPGNIILSKDASGEDLIKLVDFGMAKLIAKDGLERLTQTGEIFGSPLYMSPEQCLGQSLDARSDIYSLGCVMYEMFSGTPPFTRENVIQVILAHINDAPPSLVAILQRKGIPESLGAVIQRALAKDRADRQQSIEVLERELWCAATGQRPRLPPVRRALLILAAVMLATTGVIAAHYLVSRSATVKQAALEPPPPVAPQRTAVPSQAVPRRQLPTAPGQFASPPRAEPPLSQADLHAGSTAYDTVRTRAAKMRKYIATIKDQLSAESYDAHNSLRDAYYRLDDPHKSMQECDFLLRYWVMDRYMLDTLCGWEATHGRPREGISRLLANADKFPDTKFVKAACYVEVGNLCAAQAEPSNAALWYQKVLSTTGLDLKSYRAVAQSKLAALKSVSRR